jgi:hypothetical protein
VNQRILATVLALASVAAVAALGVWYHTSGALQQSRQIVTGTVETIASLLNDNRALMRELQGEPFTEKDDGILESYLIKLRREGIIKNAQMKQRLDQLAENNTAIVTLIKVHSPHAKTPGFVAEADKFQNYASAWRDRWNSVMELFMAGGNYAASEVPFPKGFPDIVQAEIAAAR